MEAVEARLKAVEQIVTDGRAQTAVQIDTLPANRLPDSILKHGEVDPDA